jgi:hypothetical protein
MHMRRDSTRVFNSVIDTVPDAGRRCAGRSFKLEAVSYLLLVSVVVRVLSGKSYCCAVALADFNMRRRYYQG